MSITVLSINVNFWFHVIVCVFATMHCKSLELTWDGAQLQVSIITNGRTTVTIHEAYLHVSTDRSSSLIELIWDGAQLQVSIITNGRTTVTIHEAYLHVSTDRSSSLIELIWDGAQLQVSIITNGHSWSLAIYIQQFPLTVAVALLSSPEMGRGWTFPLLLTASIIVTIREAWLYTPVSTDRGSSVRRCHRDTPPDRCSASCRECTCRWHSDTGFGSRTPNAQGLQPKTTTTAFIKNRTLLLLCVRCLIKYPP